MVLRAGPDVQTHVMVWKVLDKWKTFKSVPSTLDAETQMFFNFHFKVTSKFEILKCKKNYNNFATFQMLYLNVLFTFIPLPPDRE